MSWLENILQTILAFLLQLLTLIANFFILVLQFILHFAQTLVSSVQ